LKTALHGQKQSADAWASFNRGGVIGLGRASDSDQ
jgi:hypothetical protein